MIALLPLLASCQDRRATPAKAYRHFDDQVQVHFGGLFGAPCTRNVTQPDGTTINEGLDPLDCLKFGPPERIDGVWINLFEVRFLLTKAQYASGIRRDELTWLHFASRLRGDYPEGAYHVVFIGRRALYAGRYGHLGGSNHLVIAERIEKIEPMQEAAVLKLEAAVLKFSPK